MYHICAVIGKTQKTDSYLLDGLVFEFSKMSEGCIMVNDLPQNTTSGIYLSFEVEKE